MTDPATSSQGMDLRGSRDRAVRHIATGLASVAAVIAFGVAGYLFAGWSFADAIYLVVVTISTVGYGEVRPIDTTYLRVHTMLLIALGIVAVGYTVAGILRFVTEQELTRLMGHQRVRRMIDSLSDHTIVAGLGRMGSLVCEELAAAGESFVVIDESADRLATYGSRNWLLVGGDATEESVLNDAGLAR